MQISNPFFNTQTKIADVEQLTDRLLALALKDTQLIGEVSALRNDVSKAQYTAIASSENLLINPRGKINQLNESDGVLSAGQYFCDGWKAGAAGAEVYRDSDGFRLVSGSILQLVPNILDANCMIRGNMKIISGAPSISINSASDSELSNTANYIQFEVSGDNSKFTRLILAESDSLPIYQQPIDELIPCLRFVRTSRMRYRPSPWQKDTNSSTGLGVESVEFGAVMHTPISVSVTKHGSTSLQVVDVSKNGFSLYDARASSGGACILGYVADARP